MALQTKVLSAIETGKLLTLSEGHFTEAKSIDIEPAKLTKTISAFANADGGEVYIGLFESNKKFQWIGFPNEESANGHLQIFEKLFPLGTGFEYTFLTSSGQPGSILHIQVAKLNRIVTASDGTPYLRRGAQNHPVNTAEALKILERNKGLVSFENETVAVSLDVILKSEVLTKFINSVVPKASPEVWVRKQQLVLEKNPTVAGVVLFSDTPQASLPKRTGIKIYRYKTSNLEGTRETLVAQPITVEGCAYDLIHDAVSKTEELINQLQVLSLDGLSKVEYPPETLHEVITNAVLHRDYSVADDVHIRVFDNRVEVESPGRLPGHVTTANILSERFARNGNLVRIINKFPNPPNKDVGEGLNTAFDAMRKLKLKDPIIQERENSVLIQIRHEKLASAEEIVLGYLAESTFITNSIARKLAGISSENAVKTVFYRLQKRGLLERVQKLDGNKAAWRLTRKGKTQAHQRN